MKAPGKPRPVALVVIAIVWLLSALGYVLSTALERLGVLQVEVALETRILGILITGMWCLGALCIFKRSRWGWPICLLIVGGSILLEFARMGFGGSAVLGGQAGSMIGLFVSVVIGFFVVRHRAYFVGLEHRVG